MDRRDGGGLRRARQAGHPECIGSHEDEAKNKLRQMLRDQDDGISVQPGSVTVEQAVRDWLQFGLPGRSDHTVAKCRDLSESHIVPHLGARRLRDLSAPEVDRWLAVLAPKLSTTTVRMTRGVLSRAVKRAMARDQSRRNVVDLTEIPQGRPGPGRSR